MENARASDRTEPGRERPSREPPPAGARPLRVAMLASVFPPSIGGIQSHTLRLSQALVDRGLEVHVVTRIQPGLAPFERMGGVRVHRVGLASASGPAGSAAFIVEGARALARLAAGGHVEVIHAHQLLSPTTIGLLVSPLARLPLIANPHACGPLGDVGVLSATSIGRLRLRAAVRRAHAFVAVSRSIRDELEAAGVTSDRIWSISNGVDTERFCPALPEEKRVVRRALGLSGRLVLYSGRLAKEKGVEVLIGAWPSLAARVPGAHLCIVGCGEEEGRLRQQARALRVEACVTFTGSVTDVTPYLRASDLAVLPSRTEGMPVALLEAMSCAVPVVATGVGGNAEVVKDGVTGRLVPPDAAAALADALAEALLEPAPAARRAEAARAHVLAHHAMAVVAERFVSLYRTLVGRRDARLELATHPSPR